MARQQDEQKRARILESAFVTFGEKGYRKTSMKDIASQAGVATGSIYTYFRDKEDLFRSTIDEGWNSFFTEMDRVMSSVDPYETKIQHIIDYGFDLLRKAHPLLRGIFSEAYRLEMFQEHLDQLTANFRTLFESGPFNRSENSKRPEEQKSFFIRTFLSGILLNTALTPLDRLDSELEIMKKGMKREFGVDFPERRDTL